MPSNTVQNGTDDLKTESDNKESEDVEDKEVNTEENDVKEIENEVKKSDEKRGKKTRSIDIRKYFDELYKEYFEKIIGKSIYSILPDIEKCIYC